MRLALTFLAVLAIVGGAGYIAWQQVPALVPENVDVPRSIADVTKTLDELQHVSTPPPLRLPQAEVIGSLTVPGILVETNRHRATEGATALSLNSQLSAAAQAKVDDMFAQQYFEHVSPDGVAPANLVTQAGYAYIRVGENLALGGFEDDVALVQAWMDSPGHRANIVEAAYSEIGIAIGRGVFEGSETWLAVQTFGRPASDCAMPDASLRERFAEAQSEHTALTESLALQQDDLELERDELNELAEEITNEVAEANEKVNAGNKKIEQGNELAASGDSEAAATLWEEGEQLQEDGRQLFESAEELQGEHKAASENFNAARSVYNSEVAEQNELTSELEALASQLNTQINSYNACIQN